MKVNDISESIRAWTDWAKADNNNQYDIALLKIWIQFEKFMAELFVAYATGNESEEGFSPDLKLRFTDEEQLNVFLRDGNRTYIDYPAQIKKLSKHIFSTDPFDVIFLDADVNVAYNQIVALRNFIVHESGEAKTKMIKVCFGGRDDHFKSPNDFLLTKQKSTSKTYYTYYIDIINNTAKLLVNPPK